MLPPLFAEVAPISAMSKCSLDVKLGREKERDRKRERKTKREMLGIIFTNGQDDYIRQQ